MYHRPREDEDACGLGVLQRAVDIALTVVAQTEWLVRRPTIPLIMSPGLNVPGHVQTVVRNVRHLADDLDRTLEDPKVRHHESLVVDSVLVAALNCRMFASRWTGLPDIDAEEFNEALGQLRHDIDQVMRSLT